MRSLGLVCLLVLSTAIAAFGGPAAAEAPNGWGTPMKLGGGMTYYEVPDHAVVAVGAEGRTLVAWDDYNPDQGYRNVYYQWYTPSAGWGDGGVIWEFWGDDVINPAVAASANGDFFLVCEDHGGIANPTIRAFQYNAASLKWAELTNPNTDLAATSVIQPQVGMDDHGNAVVVWRTSDGSENNVSANRFNKGSGFDAAEVAVDTDAAAASNPRVVVDWSGHATAGWQQSVGGHVRFYTSGQDNGDAWSAPVAVDGESYDAYNIQLAVDRGANVLATYLQNNGSNSNIYGTGKTPTSNWSAPMMVSNNPNYAAGLERVAGGGGAFAVAWGQFDGSEYQLEASVYTQNAWTTPINLSAAVEAGGNGNTPYVGVDISGNVMVMWLQYSPDHNLQVWSARWTPAGGWMAPQMVGGGGPDQTFKAMAMGLGGDAVALYNQNNGYGSEIWGVGFSRPDTTPPDLFAYVVGGDTTANSSVVVEGSGAIESTTVNGVPAFYVDFGIWHAIVPVHPGNNSLAVSAHDAAGNYASMTLYVNYTDPVPGLQAQIAAAQAEAEEGHAVAHAVDAELDATKHDLNTTQQALATAQTEIAQLRASQNSSASAQTAATQAAANAAGSAAMLGVLGVIVGLAGAGIALMAMRKPKVATVEAAPSPSTPAPSPPKSEEPPK